MEYFPQYLEIKFISWICEFGSLCTTLTIENGWWFGSVVRIGLDQRSCATSDPVSSRMGDHLWAGKPSQYVTSQLGQLSLLPSMGW